MLYSCFVTGDREGEETGQEVEERMSEDELFEDLKEEEVVDDRKAEDRLLVDIGSLFFPSTYPRPQRSQGTSKQELIIIMLTT